VAVDVVEDEEEKDKEGKMRILSIAVALMLVGGCAYAEGLTDLLDKLPEFEQGVAWDIEDDALLTTTTLSPIIWKWNDKPKASIGGGMAYDLDDYAYPIATASYIIGGCEQFGFDYPFKDLITLKVFGFIGKEFNAADRKWHGGIGLGVLQAKF
jgi:hypothetical protein